MAHTALSLSAIHVTLPYSYDRFTAPRLHGGDSIHDLRPEQGTAEQISSSPGAEDRSSGVIQLALDMGADMVGSGKLLCDSLMFM